MKKLILLIAVVAMMLPGCKKINEELDALGNRLDKLEQEAIPSIDEQIVAINTTLSNLDAMDKELKGYINNLTSTASNLQEQINSVNTKIGEVKAALQGEISTAKADVLAQLDAVKTELENELAQINATIATLQAKDAELDGKIADLKTYVDNELGKTTDWVSATFATLEQYNALVSEVATIKEQIKAINQSITDLETRLTTKINEDIATAVSTLNADIQQKVKEITDAYTAMITSTREGITAAYTIAIQTAIVSLDASLKSWVGEQLANYYTIAEVEAKITALQTAITEGDNALQDELNKLKTQLETIKSEIAAAYKKAIEEAINTNNGVINTKIANEIAAVNQRINSEVATINAKIAELQAQVNQNTEDIAKLLARIQSVSYIPTYSDGKATVIYTATESKVSLDFEISPKDAVVELAKVWDSAISTKAIYTQTRAIEYIDMPIIKFEADAENGIISVTASGENLSEEFFAGVQEASCRLAISDGNNSVTSEYITMVAKGIDISTIMPTNEIWYTTADGKKMFPYSSGGATFGAILVSNTYKDGKGVLVFDDTVTLIGDDAFKSCTALTSVTIPDSVASIGNYAFDSCTSLTSVTIPDSVASIGERAFYDCTSLTSVHIFDLSAWCKIDFSNSYANPLRNGIELHLNGNKVTDVTIPSDIIEIKDCTFYGCTSLTSVTIPDSVTSIGERAFYGCTSLTSITIPDSVTSIGRYAISDCASLTSVTIGNSVTSIGERAFYGCTSLTSITIPDSVTSIGNAAFYGCTSLTSVHIFDLSAWCKIDFGNSYANPLRNGIELHLNGNKVTDVTIPSDIIEIKDCTFYGYTSLTSVTIGNSVTSIGVDAFYECSSLTSVTIPDSVASIGGRAFAACSSLKEVYCKATTPPTGGSFMFSTNASGRKIYVPTASVDAYKSAEYWSNYASYIEGYDF